MLTIAGCDVWERPVTRVSEQPDGTAADGTFSGAPTVSNDGEVVGFTSDATNLVANDENGQVDAFVRTGADGSPRRASVSSAGVESNGRSYNSVVSGDGRFVVFGSDGSNLVAGDTNGVTDVFVRDLENLTTERVSVSSTGAQGDRQSFGSVGISDDGRYVAFSSHATNLVAGDTNNHNDVFVRDRSTGTTERVSVSSGGAQGNGQSAGPALSADGRFVAWGSGATNLVAGDTNGTYDGFLRDRQAGTTERFNVSSSEAQAETGPTTWYGGHAISDDGRYVSFVEDASNLVSGDTNGVRDVFVRDRQAGLTGRVSISSDGTQQNGHATGGAISADGRTVAFLSDATNLVDNDTNGLRNVFVRDRDEGTTRRIDTTYEGRQSAGGHAQNVVSMSNDGTFIAFDSGARLTPRDTTTIDVYLRDVTRPGFDSIYRTANWNHDCTDGGLNCQTDNVEFRVFAEDSLPADSIDTIEAVLDGQFEPTTLDVEWDAEPVYEGDTETDVVYLLEEFEGDDDPLAGTWCDDAVGGTDWCDQHYVQFDPDYNDPIDRQGICHETGHAVGLTHGEDADPPQANDDSRLLSCMTTPVDGSVTLGRHNADMIRAIYG